MNHVCTYEPEPGTERVHCLKCQICGARHMSRTRLCDACARQCMELGRGIMLAGNSDRDKHITVKKGGAIVIEEKQTWGAWDVLAAWVIGTAVVYFGIHIIVAIMSGSL